MTEFLQVAPRTVRVRIPVGIDPSGHWHAAGWADGRGTEHARAAVSPSYEFKNPELVTMVAST